MDPRLVHIRDSDGATPLHFCASRGHLSAAKLLLTSGASPDHADLWGKTPVHDALENRHQEVRIMQNETIFLPSCKGKNIMKEISIIYYLKIRFLRCHID